MQRVAIPFSDLASGERAVAALVRDVATAAAEVELVAMVEPLRPGKVAAFVSEAAARAQVTAAAQEWLAALEARLRSAGLRCRGSIAVGPPTVTLRRLAERSDVSRIWMAEPHAAPWRSWWRHFALRAARPAITVVP
jgi:nucleotide-binding universal stress UspA family protein